MTVKGLMFKKGNYPRWASRIIEGILKDLLMGEYSLEHFVNILQAEKEKLKNGDINYKELIVNARLGKPLDEYAEKALVYVTIARRLQEKGYHVPTYSTISYFVTDGDKNLVALEEREIDENSKYDAVYYWNKVLMAQAESILSPAFPEYDWESLRFPRNLKRNPFELKVKVKL